MSILHPFEGFTLVHHSIPMDEMDRLDHDPGYKSATTVKFKERAHALESGRPRLTWQLCHLLPVTLGSYLNKLKSKSYICK